MVMVMAGRHEVKVLRAKFLVILIPNWFFLWFISMAMVWIYRVGDFVTKVSQSLAPRLGCLVIHGGGDGDEAARLRESEQ